MVYQTLPQALSLGCQAEHGGFESCVALVDAKFLYQFKGQRAIEPIPSPYILRQKSSSDDHGLFQLYNAAVPAAARQAEGMTFREWRETRGKGSRGEFVYEKEGSLVGWLRAIADGGMGRFDIMIHPLEEERLDWLVNRSLVLLNGKSPIFCLIPEFQPRLRRFLTEQDFEEVAEYSTLVKQLAARVRQTQFVPASA